MRGAGAGYALPSPRPGALARRAAGLAGLELGAILGFSRAHAAGESRPAEVARAVLEGLA